MNVGRPEFLQVAVFLVHKAQGGHVVEKGVDPYIDHMARIKIHRDSPGKAGPGDTQVLQSRLNEVVYHLVDPAAGLQKVGVFQKVPDPVGILGQTEEVGLLLRVLHIPTAVGAFAVHQLALRPKAFAGLAVFAHIFPLVNIALIVHGFKDLLNGGNMIAVGGADEPVVGNVHQLPQVQNALLPLHDPVHILLGGDARLFGLVLDFLSMLVSAGEEHNVIAPEPLIPGHGVGGYGTIGVPDMELIGRVIDRGRNIKFFRHGRQPPFSLPPLPAPPADDLK